jgi:hypothetical protein
LEATRRRGGKFEYPVSNPNIEYRSEASLLGYFKFGLGYFAVEFFANYSKSVLNRLPSLHKPLGQHLVVDFGSVHQDAYSVDAASEPGGQYKAAYKKGY